MNMFQIVICACFATLLVHQAEVVNATTLVDLFAQGGDCRFYDMMESTYKCGSSGYLIGYGKKYCNRFGSYSSEFSETGRKWLKSVSICLMNRLLEKTRAGVSSCADIKTTGFDSHVDCYLNPSKGSLNFCEIVVVPTNLKALAKTYMDDPRDIFSSEAAKQMWSIANGCWNGVSADDNETDAPVTELAENGDCSFYKALDNQMNCGDEGYLRGYGAKYCKRFDIFYDMFNPKGQTWVDSVRTCLMKRMIEITDVESDCDVIKQKGFESHVDCYLNPSDDSPGFCQIVGSNKLALFFTYKFKDFASTLALKQVGDVSLSCGKDVVDWFKEGTSDLIDKIIGIFG